MRVSYTVVMRGLRYHVLDGDGDSIAVFNLMWDAIAFRDSFNA